MGNVLDQMFVEILVDDGKLNKSISGSINKFKDFARNTISILGAIAVAIKINEIVDQFTQGSDDVAKFSRQLGESSDKMQVFSEVAVRSGGSVNGFRSSMESLTEKIGQASMGQGEGAEIFSRIGISAMNANGQIKKSSQILLELNGSFQKLSSTKQIEYGKKLGLDSGTIKMIQQSPKALQDLIKRQTELGVVNKKTLEQSEKYRDSIADTQQSWNSLVGSILEHVLPAFTFFQEKLQDLFIFMRENKAFIIGFIAGIGAIIATAAVPPMVALAAATVTAFLPFIKLGAIAAAVGLAIGLIFDDVMSFLNGGDSVIGKFTGFFKTAFDFLMKFNIHFKLVVNIIKSIVYLFKQLTSMSWGSMDDFINNMLTIGENIKSALENAFNGLKEKVKPIIDWILEAWTTMVQNLEVKFKPFLDGIDNVKDGIGNTWSNIKGMFGMSSNQQTSNNSTSNSMGVNTINVNVPSGNPQQIATGISSELSTAMFGMTGARSY